MSFGLTNAHVAFMDLAKMVLKHFFDRSAVMFIDNIIIYSSSCEKYEDHFTMFLQTLRDKLYAKFTKFEFWLDQVTFLDHVKHASYD